MVAEKGASGDFDYLREESDGSDGVDVYDEGNEYESEPDLDYLLAADEPQGTCVLLVKIVPTKMPPLPAGRT